MKELGLVYLARAANGIAPVRRFVEAYRRNRGGIEHELIVVFKGFRDETAARQERECLGDFAHQALFIPDAGFDLDGYSAAAAKFDCRCFCFVNSFSEPLDTDWLAKLHRQLVQPGVGLVGGTGSFESLLNNIQLEASSPMGVPLHKKLMRPLRLAWARRWFEPFPNPHIRTNAFMLAAEVWRKVKPGPLRWKLDALRYESGKDSLTNRVARLGLATLIVGKDGQAFAPADWPRSRTLRLGDQSNLLVMDNRTRQFAEASAQLKQHLARLAWGERALSR